MSVDGSAAQGEERLSRIIEIASEAAMLAFGARLCDVARPGDVICLSGDLGAGKTVLARGFIRSACAAKGEEAERFDVPSPTFTLVQVYEGPAFDIWHFDLYRLERPQDIFELGFEEALDGAVSLIEWPGQAGDLLPGDRLDVILSTGISGEEADLKRNVEMIAGANWQERMKHV